MQAITEQTPQDTGSGERPRDQENLRGTDCGKSDSSRYSAIFICYCGSNRRTLCSLAAMSALVETLVSSLESGCDEGLDGCETQASENFPEDQSGGPSDFPHPDGPYVISLEECKSKILSDADKRRVIYQPRLTSFPRRRGSRKLRQPLQTLSPHPRLGFCPGDT